jgi:chromosome segregation ATPase
LLAVSLKSLRDSAEKLSQNNDRLMSEIKSFRLKIDLIQEELDNLSDLQDIKGEVLQEAQIDSKVKDQTEEVAFMENERSRLDHNVSQLEKEHVRLDGKRKLKESHELEIHEDIKTVEQQVHQLRERIDALAGNTDEASFAREREKLIDSKKTSAVSLNDVQRKYEKLNKEHAGPLKNLDKLKKEHVILEHDATQLQDELQALVYEEKEILEEIENIKQRSEEDLGVLNTVVDQLKDRKQELEKGLFEHSD